MYVHSSRPSFLWLIATLQFPKGRIDSLTNHLVKKCPALPVRDRQRAILQFHELPDLPDVTQQPGGQSMSLPFAPKQGMSALETLAEVSRQRLDLSGQQGPDKGRSKSPPPQSGLHNGSLDEFLVQDDRPENADLSVMTDRSGESLCDSLQHWPFVHFVPVQERCESCTDFFLTLCLARSI